MKTSGNSSSAIMAKMSRSYEKKATIIPFGHFKEKIYNRLFFFESVIIVQ